ncbi:2-dehydro-3-deoxy-6-phosphogalactonate aldolase [Aurantiacibacter flavus]|uniref:2-dehydro-3-deoxy-6-phosphogalactonate aldolase n=1 Tax=Aurantiacibacter flavus TaxID=3145232 RepID=A0ABV0CRQ9_9SPHN
MSLTLEDALAKVPVIAILRGIKPHEAPAIGSALVDAGILAMEVTFNSPDPLGSVRALCKTLSGRAVIGVGTVLSEQEVRASNKAGARFVVSPNMDPRVIGCSCDLGMKPLPGVATATEAFAAIEAGATALKLFPAATYGPRHLKALKDVLPAEVKVFAVGGVGEPNISQWMEAGASGFGIGSSLYSAGRTAEEVGAKARKLAEFFHGADNRV